MNRDDQLCWYHGKITRESAEELLKSEGTEEDGAFLVRESNTAIGDFVLTVLYQGEVCHYQIRRHGEDAFFSIDDKVKILHGLDTLVEFYQQDSNGLLTKLGKGLRKDPPPNDARSHGVTNLLHRATKENNHRIVSELLKCGYRNVDAKNQDGQTAVHVAALYSDEQMLQLLLNANVNVNCMDTAGNTPLHYASRHQSVAFVSMLINANANVQGRNIKNGYVALHEAAKHANLPVVQQLLAAHAPLLPRTSSGEFPIDLAKETGAQQVVEFLEHYKPPAPNTMKSQWYHGTLGRMEAVNALMEYASVKQREQKAAAAASAEGEGEGSQLATDNSGYFLVRYSERKGAASSYVLTLLWNNQPKNFIISQSTSYFYIDEGPYLPSLDHLISHFMRFADGLPVNLKHAVLPKPKPPLPLFSTMPRASQKKSSDALHPQPSLDYVPADVRKLSLDAQQSQTLNHKPQKKHKENQSSSVFNTLKLRSPKKSILMDSMNSLRKSKFKSKSTVAAAPEQQPTKIIVAEQLPLLKNLSFSTDFANLQLSEASQTPTPTDGFYNVPQNNASVAADASALAESTTTEGNSKTETEAEYFTKSDVLIARDRFEQQLLPQSSSAFAKNANGYIPTVDVRVFMDQAVTPSLGGENTQQTLEESAAQLREFAHHPERLDSLISTTSTESGMMRYLQRQCSDVSNATLQSEVATPAKPNYLIARDCLELENIIGEGEFGSVYSGCLIKRDAEGAAEVRCAVAIKTLRDEHCRSNKQEFLREASVMIRLQHHCIVQLIGICKGETLMMVQEMVRVGSMLNFILEHKAKINANYELKLWASQIACGMQYLESHHFVHRDLAARNILLASRNQAKISDFGLSRALCTGNDCYQASQGGKWPIKWYAPESYNNGIFSHASDVWSFGVTLWEMFSLGDAPYGDIRGVDAIKLIESGQRLTQPALCPDYIYDIMKNCWNYKPKDRPTFRYLTDFFAKDPDYQNIMELVNTEHIC